MNYHQRGASHKAHREYMHARWSNGFRRPKYNVPMNIRDLDTYYEAHIYATGFEKEKIKVNVSDDVLIITGTRAIDETNPPAFILQEFPVKNFERRIFLREQVESTSITARQEDGVLIITLPKNKATQENVREIQVA